jgi:osmotically inducible lipoprotein OsmB
MLRSIKLKKIATLLLAVIFLLVSIAPDAEAQRRRRRPSKTKNIAVGTAIGAVGGALIGGRKGALIGAGAGAAGGYGAYKLKKRKYRRRY